MRLLILVAFMFVSMLCTAGNYSLQNTASVIKPHRQTGVIIKGNKITHSQKHNSSPVINTTSLFSVDSIVIRKANRELLAYNKGVLIKKYKVALGLNPIGPKEVEGDYKTPEGLYHINEKNPTSRYHKSLGISYPNQKDIERAKALGKRPGGDIMIHGLMKNMNNKGKDHIKSDWTFGCIAITDEEIVELFNAVNIGVKVLITP